MGTRLVYLPDTRAFLAGDKLERPQQPESEHWGLLTLGVSKSIM
jgi:hypothetical protein